jgi:hypothetical protein
MKCLSESVKYQDPEEETNLEGVLEQDEMDNMKDNRRFAKPEVLLGWLYFRDLVRFVG